MDADGFVEHAATMDFEPMTLDGIMSNTEFQKNTQSIYITLAIAERLLSLDPDQLADALVSINPENPTATFDAIQSSSEWLEGIAAVLNLVENRILTALSKRVTQS